MNTALYTVTINEGTPDTASESESYREYSVYEALELIKKARGKQHGSGSSTKSLLDALARKVEAAHELNKELDTLLQRTEMPEFYNNPKATKIKKAFRKIAADAKDKAKAKKLLELQHGTPRELCDVIEEALKEIYRAYKKKKKEVPKDIPQDLSDPDNIIAAVFLAAAEKLRAIETAKWAKESRQQHLLSDQIKYTCVFTPRVDTQKLKVITHEVTVIPMIGLSGIKFTVGPFISDLHDDHYISDKNKKITLGAQNRLAMPLGGLAHMVLFGKDFSKFSSALL